METWLEEPVLVPVSGTTTTKKSSEIPQSSSNKRLIVREIVNYRTISSGAMDSSFIQPNVNAAAEESEDKAAADVLTVAHLDLVLTSTSSCCTSSLNGIPPRCWIRAQILLSKQTQLPTTPISRQVWTKVTFCTSFGRDIFPHSVKHSVSFSLVFLGTRLRCLLPLVPPTSHVCLTLPVTAG